MAASGPTSFQKKNRTKVVQIAGTRPSLHNNQLLISTGVPSLDNAIGGGVAVGTVLVIEEDVYGSYSKMMLKYYLAEGIMNKHGILLASGDGTAQNIIDELPQPIVDDPEKNVGQNVDNSSNMKIAWRYQNQPQVQSSGGGMRFGHYYDLTKTMDHSRLSECPPTLLDVTESSLKHCLHCGEINHTFMRQPYAHLLHRIQHNIEEGAFSTTSTVQHRNILRIGIHSLGSPQWGEEAGWNSHKHSGVDPSLCRFLYALKALMRTAYATCVITVPTHLYQDSCLTKRIEHLSDLVLRLESFAGSDKEKNPSFKEYHGLFHLIKLPRLNSLTCHMPDTMDLAFKLRKKKFMIEKLHLPPELSDTVSRSQEDPVLPKSTTGCATTGNSKLDF